MFSLNNIVFLEIWVYSFYLFPSLSTYMIDRVKDNFYVFFIIILKNLFIKLIRD